MEYPITPETKKALQYAGALTAVNVAFFPVNAYLSGIATKAALTYAAARTVLLPIAVPTSAIVGGVLGAAPVAVISGLGILLNDRATSPNEEDHIKSALQGATVSGALWALGRGITAGFRGSIQTTATFASPLTSRKIIFLECLSAIQTASAYAVYSHVSSRPKG